MRIYYTIEFDGPHAFGLMEDGTIGSEGMGSSGSLEITSPDSPDKEITQAQALDEAENMVKQWLASGAIQTLSDDVRQIARCLVPTHHVRRVILTLFGPKESLDPGITVIREPQE